MDDTVILYAFIALTGITTVSFIATFVLVVRYLMAVYALQQHLKSHDAELYNSLGRPDLSPTQMFGRGPVASFQSTAAFALWLLKGGGGEKDVKTGEKVLRTRKQLFVALACFCFASLSFIAMFAAGFYGATGGYSA